MIKPQAQLEEEEPVPPMEASEAPATASDVYDLAARLRLDEAAHRRAVELAGLAPKQSDGLRHLDRFLIVLGSLLIVTGIAAFFAWNWDGLGPMARFALIQGALLGAAGLASWLRPDTPGGRGSLFAAAFLVGVLFAVFGQVYQTGADPYGLFLVWALLILPWVLIGRQTGLWLLWLLLLNLTLILYWTQVLYPPDGLWEVTRLMGPLVWLAGVVMDWRLASWLFALNGLTILAWEIAARRDGAWLPGRWFVRVAAVMALYTLLGPTLVLILVATIDLRTNVSVVSPLLFAAALAVCLWYYRDRKPDLFMLTGVLFGAILVVMSLAIRFLFQGVGSLLFLALLLIALVGSAAYWLRQVALESRSPA